MLNKAKSRPKKKSNSKWFEFETCCEENMEVIN